MRAVGGCFDPELSVLLPGAPHRRDAGERLLIDANRKLPQVRERQMIEEFKKFALRGNAVDLAIGVVIDAAFGAIVNSLVGDVMSPIIGAVTGGFDFSNYFLPLSAKVTATSLAEARKQGAVLAWGSFLTVVINFIIIAWVLFLVVKLMNQMMQSEAPKTPAMTKQETLLTEIRDLLKREQR